MVRQKPAGTRSPSVAPPIPRALAAAAMPDLQGDLLAATGSERRRELAQAVGKTAVLLDRTGAAFVDPAGLGVSVGVRRVRERGGRVAIAGADPRRGVARALQAAGVDRLVRIADSFDRAPRVVTSLVRPELYAPCPNPLSPCTRSAPPRNGTEPIHAVCIEHQRIRPPSARNLEMRVFRAHGGGRIKDFRVVVGVRGPQRGLSS